MTEPQRCRRKPRVARETERRLEVRGETRVFTRRADMEREAPRKGEKVASVRKGLARRIASPDEGNVVVVQTADGTTYVGRMLALAADEVAEADLRVDETVPARVAVADWPTAKDLTARQLLDGETNAN